MNIDEMRAEVYTLGDYTKAEVEKMTVAEVIDAWSALPMII